MGNVHSYARRWCIYDIPKNVSASLLKYAISQLGHEVLSVSILRNENCCSYIVLGNDVDASILSLNVKIINKYYQMKRSTSRRHSFIAQHAEHMQIGVSYKHVFTPISDCTEYSINLSVTLAPVNTLAIFLSHMHTNAKQKLEFKMEDIWPHIFVEKVGQSKIIIIFNVKRPPIISTDINSDTENLDYWQVFDDVAWGRSADFTKSGRIGVCTAYMLEFTYSDQLWAALDSFEVKGETFSFNTKSFNVHPVYPISLGIEFPLEVEFKLRCLYTQGIVIDPQVTRWEGVEEWHRKIKAMAETRAVWFLSELEKQSKDAVIDPMDFLLDENIYFPSSIPRPLDHLMYVKKAVITPTRCVFIGPELEVSNRVLRFWRDSQFMRIYFRDENFCRYKSTDLTGSIMDRIKRILNNAGIYMGDLRYEFLAYSSSQLREHCCWFFSKTIDLSVGGIHNWMGVFNKEKCVAKYGARQGQCFSTTICTGTVDMKDVKSIPDIWDKTNKYCFSDGLGQISESFARYNSERLGKLVEPYSAFQIRIAGYKGVVLINRDLGQEVYESDGRKIPFKLALRPSMEKFTSSYYQFEIANVSRYIAFYLNRQIIVLLSCLGIPDQVFIDLQNSILETLDRLTSDPNHALALLYYTDAPVNRMLIAMIEAGFPLTEPYINSTLLSMKARYLQDLRTRSRILIKDGCVLMGGMDESLTLNYGECFIQFIDPVTGKKRVITGPVMVTRSPCLHPGDIRVLNAVTHAKMVEDFTDVIIFPAKGECPHAHEMSNGDLDGDIFNISWNPALIPQLENLCKPANVSPLSKPSTGVTTELIKEFYVDYMKNDTIGAISDAHAARADISVLGAKDRGCLILAELAAQAVDFAKTGVSVLLPNDLKPEKYPTYMEFYGHPSYESEKVIGRLYKAVVDINKATDAPEIAGYDKSLVMSGFTVSPVEDHIWKYLQLQHSVFLSYVAEVSDLMLQFNVDSESEFLSGKLTPSVHNRRGMKLKKKKYDERQQMLELFQALHSKYRVIFWADLEVQDVYSFMAQKKASAWYYIAHTNLQNRFLSYGWIAYDVLCFKKKYP